MTITVGGVNIVVDGGVGSVLVDDVVDESPSRDSMTIKAAKG